MNSTFWTGSQMGFGVEFSYLLELLDVVGHEFTYGVMQYTCNLIYQVQSGDLNEVMSDIMWLVCESYFYGNDKENWLIGDDVYIPGKPGDRLRDKDWFKIFEMFFVSIEIKIYFKSLYK